jgi:hypothetical protein
MRFVLFVGFLFATAYGATKVPWWGALWVSVLWCTVYVGMLRRAWKQAMMEAQTTAVAEHLSKDVGDDTPPDIKNPAYAFMGYGVLVIPATAILTSLLWFTWS